MSGLLTFNCWADGSAVDYPEGYREWTHVKSMLIDEGHPLFEAFGGIHHLYANQKALKGYRTGKFPKGSVIVFDLLEAVEANDAVTEGARKVLGVMQKDEKRFAATGGWGFEGFARGDAAERVVQQSADTACYQCHTSQRQNDFVFSVWRE
jgi:hypothetical protein